MASIHKRKTKSGETRYEVRFRDPSGRERSKWIKRKVDAERFGTEMESAKHRGAWRDPKVGRMTFAEWTERHTASSIDKRATTRARDDAVLRTHLLPHLGARPLDSITQPDVRAVVAKMAETLAPATVRTNYGVLRAVLQAAVDADVLVKNPCHRIRLPEKAPRDIRFLTADELHRLADALPADYRVLAWLGGGLGLRWSEAIGLRVGRVDLAARRIEVVETIAEVNGVVQSAPPKSRASRRTLPVPGFVADEIATHLLRTGRRADPSALVVQAPEGGPLRKHWSRRVWKPAVERAGLAPLTFHELRHSFVGLLIEAGAHPKVIQERCGHSSIQLTFDLYGHVLPKVDEAVTAGLDRALRTARGVAAGLAES